MLFDIFNSTIHDKSLFNYWYFSQNTFNLLKKNLNHDVLNLLISSQNFDSKKLILVDTEDKTQLNELVNYIQKYSNLKLKSKNINLYDLFQNSLKIKIDEIFLVVDENENLSIIQENINKYNIKPKIILNKNDNFDTLNSSFEDIKNKIIKYSKKNNFNYILILNDFLFNDEIIKQIYNKNVSINIPDDFNNFYLDYDYETTNYRFDNYIIKLSSYNIDKSSIVNLNNDSTNYYGIYPILNSKINNNKNILIRKNNYMRSLYKYPTYLINLDRRQDRFKNYLLNNGDTYPNITRFSAIDGKKYDFTNYKTLFDISEYNKFNNIKNPYESHKYRKGVLGCALSHYILWNIIKDNDKLNDNDYVLILEDDLKFSNDFNLELNQLLEYIHYDNDWDVIFLGFTDYKNYNDNRVNDMLIKFSGELRMRGGGTFAYFIRKKAAKKYIDFAHKYKIQQSVDFFMIELFDKMTVYKCEPEIIFSTVSNNIIDADSDVQNSNEVFKF